MINQKKSPIQDDYIEKYSAEKDWNLTATLDAKAAYKDVWSIFGVRPHKRYINSLDYID